MKYTTDDLSPSSGRIRDVALGEGPAGAPLLLRGSATPSPQTRCPRIFPEQQQAPHRTRTLLRGCGGHLHLPERLLGGGGQRESHPSQRPGERSRGSCPRCRSRPPPAPTPAERVGEAAEAKEAWAALPVHFPASQEPLGTRPRGSPGAIPEALQPGDKPVTMGAPRGPPPFLPTCTPNNIVTEDIKRGPLLSPCHALGTVITP